MKAFNIVGIFVLTIGAAFNAYAFDVQIGDTTVSLDSIDISKVSENIGGKVNQQSVQKHYDHATAAAAEGIDAENVYTNIDVDDVVNGTLENSYGIDSAINFASEEARSAYESALNDALNADAIDDAVNNHGMSLDQAIDDVTNAPHNQPGFNHADAMDGELDGNVGDPI